MTEGFWNEEEDLFSAIEQEEENQEEDENIIANINSKEDIKTEKDESEEEENLFDILEEEDEEESIEDENSLSDKIDNKGKVSADEPFSLKTASFLKEKGLLELEEDVELTEENADEVIEIGFENAVEKAIEDKMSSLPDSAKNFLNFALKGGTIDQYIQTLDDEVDISSGLVEGMDLDNENVAEKIARIFLDDEDNDKETIDDLIESYKDSGKLKDYATKKYNKWLKAKEEAEKQIVLNQNKERQRQIQELKEAKEEALQILEKEDLVVGIEVDKTLAKKTSSYTYDKTVKLQNGNSITEMQKDLLIEVPKNKKAMLQLSILLQHRNEDGTFNFEPFVNTAQTNVTQKVKQSIRRSSSAKSKGKSLADYLS